MRSGFPSTGKACGLVTLCVCLCLFGLPELPGQTWDGGAGTGVWATANNWNPNAVPGSGANLTFNASSANSQWIITLVNTSRTVGSMTFASAGGTNGFTFNTGTGTLTISGTGITNNDTATQTFNVPVTVSAAQTWKAASGDLTFNGAVSLGNNLTLSGSADTNVTGAITLTGNRTITNSSTGAVTFNNINLSNSGTSRTLTFLGSGNTSVTGVIANGSTSTAGMLMQSGTGTLTLSGANTYAGATTVSAGVLNIQNATALGTTAAGTSVTSGATLQLQNGITVGAEALTLNGAGASGQTGALDNVSGINNYGGLITLGSASTISSDSGTLNLTNTGTIAGSGYGLTLAGAGNGTISSIIGTGAGTLAKNGTGTWTLSEAGTNTYTGATNINAGTLQLGASNVIPNASAVTVASGATFDVNGYQDTVGSIAGGGNITFGASTGSSLQVGGNASTTFSGVISGGGYFVKSGTGTLTLSGANTYTGVTTVNTGTLSAGINNAIGSSSAVTVASGTTFNLNNYSDSVGSIAGAGSITLGSGALTAGNDGTSTAFSGVISGSGTLTKVGAGALTLSGVNTYTGSTTVNTGTLSAGINNAVGSGSAVTVNSGATFNLNTYADTVGSIAGTGNIALGSGALTTGADGTSTTFSGIISGTGTLTKSGTGTLSLSGTNTYTGATTISAGVLSIQSADALGNASNTSNTTVANGAALQLANNITTTNAGTLALNGTGMGGSGALQSVSGNNTWNSNVTLASNATVFSSTAGNTLTIGNASATNLFTMGGNTVTIDGPGDTWFNSNVGVTGDTGGLIKNGTGTLTFYGSNTYYTGTTTVNAGSLELVVGAFSPGWYGINGSLTIGTGPSNPALAGTVKVDIWSNSYANQISPTSAVTINSDGALSVGASTSMGSLTLNGGQVNIASGQTVTPTGDVTSNANSAHETSLISGGALTLGTGNFNVAHDSSLASDLTISSSIGGSANLNKNGAGTLTLSGSNTYTGATNINAGTLALGASNTLASTGAVAIASGSTLTLNNYTQTIGGLSGAGTLQLGSGTLIAGNGNASSTFSGAFASGDTGTFEKTGTGTLTLGSGMNLSNGTLVLNGGTLNLNGTSDTFKSLSVTANSTIDFTGSSILNILSSVTVAGGATLTIQDWTYGADYFYSANNPGSTILGQIVFTGYSPSATHWQSFDHEITPVPEPSTYGAVFMFLGLCGIVWRRRRDFRSSPPPGAASGH